MKKHDKNNVDLILKNTDALSGTPKILIRQAVALSKAGFDVSVISENFHRNLLSNPAIKCRRTFKWPRNTLFQRQFFDWQAQRKVRPGSLVIGHGDSLHQDILFLHTCVHKGAEAYPGPHNDKNLSIPFHRMIFEQGSFKEIVCVSHMMKNDIIERFNVKVPVHVIHPGHDKEIVNQVDPAAVSKIREDLKVQPGEVVLGVICSGNLENRGAFALLRGLATLSEAEKNKLRVLIVGKESKPDKVYNLAQEAGLQGRVLWMNPRPDVANLFSAIDVIVHAAKIEASGLTFLEGLALARPAITTETTGFHEILPEVQKDFIIPRQESEAIAQKVRILLENPELRQKLGEENQRVASKLTWENYDEQFMKLIENYLAQRKNS